MKVCVEILIEEGDEFMFEELQVVKAKKNLSDKVKLGCIGTIVYVHSEEKVAYEVEFFDNNWQTLDVLTVGEIDIELVKTM